ncbi:MAG: desulfoferrodoxin, partial [Bacteroidales bacterium]|nr:desulfoferrodoxin [Bacteroidales bacterium]
HYIQWIVLETDKGFHLKYLMPGQQPHARFVLADDEKVVNAAYEHCNIHSLWSSK